ncbi:ATP-binding cassette domain-containing protein [Streptomyces sp. NPDC048111]|uniref:ATP-binding cassette domain-containing protein n=1 Tax=Streptomyces sp. NPDC048111 TaxID=3365500 RepID=UPI003714E893
MDSPHTEPRADAAGAAIRAQNFGLKGPRGWAFRGIGIDAAPGSLVAVTGPSGSGRTCLLLALTGRMKPAEGWARVGGEQLPRKMAAVRRFSALGQVPGVSELDPAFTVAEHLRERVMLQRRYDGSLRSLLRSPARRRAESRALIEEALAAAGLDTAALPKRDHTSVRDLERLEALRLTVALALIHRPRLLAVDDTDMKLSDAERAAAWGLLRSLADSGITVLAVCSEVPDEADTVVTTETGAAETAVPEGAEDAEDTVAARGTAVGSTAAKGTAAKDTAAEDATTQDGAGDGAASGEGADDAIAATGSA